MYHLVAIFFVDQDADRNRRRYSTLLEEQYRIAYISQGGMSFHEAGCLSTEDRAAITDVIIEIKKQEKEAMKKASEPMSNYNPPNISNINTKSRFSSINTNYKGRPNIPKR